MKPFVNEKIAHLSEEQLTALIDRYYTNEKISDLLDEYKINVRPGELANLLPPIINNDIICPYCNIEMWTDRFSRSSYKKSAAAYCPMCKHRAILTVSVIDVNPNVKKREI